MIGNMESNIRSGISACAEVIASVKFAKVLQIILSMGNYLNAGSKIGDTIGFELSILTKLDDVKSGANQHYLLHFLVESIEKEHPELASFGLEIANIKAAARSDWDNINTTIEELAVSTTMLKSELLIAKDRKFIDVMLPFSFNETHWNVKRRLNCSFICCRFICEKTIKKLHNTFTSAF